MKSFKAYPANSGGLGAYYDVYDRRKPLLIDTAEFNDFGPNALDFTNHCFVSPYAMRMEFHANFLWYQPPQGSYLCALLFRTALPTVLGAATNECGGTDLVAYNPGGNMHISGQVTQILNLAAGEKVWAVPCYASGGAGNNLTAAVNGNVTVNYFAGKELAVL